MGLIDKQYFFVILINACQEKEGRFPTTIEIKTFLVVGYTFLFPFVFEAFFF